MAHNVARARRYFETGYEVLRHIPRRPAACVATMAGIYEELLKKIERDPGPSAARARGAFEDGETARRRAVVALERVAVVGAGLAGLAAALRLKEAGAHVELFERSRLLGGRATSFELDGVEVDNGQHVFLACCTEFLRFARSVGMEDKLRLQDRFDARILSRDGVIGTLARGALTGAASSAAFLRDLSAPHAPGKTAHWSCHPERCA